MRTFLLFAISIFNVLVLKAQFAPQVGIDGHTGIYKDSTVFVNWATACTLERGFQNIANPSLGLASVGDENSPIGKVTGAVLSLGDGGQATLTFEYPIYNDKGADFAIFENGFLESNGSERAFLELAFVEVSSDGSHFVRFPAVSNVENAVQIAGFANINAREIHNFAGKYISNYGTPFDLEDLKFEEGLDVNHITHVRIIDVVGSIDPMYASYDSQGNIVNDPFPTPFSSSGFDLTGVGVIHQKTPTSTQEKTKQVEVYPNPAKDFIEINMPHNETYTIQFYNLFGQNVLNKNIQNQQKIDISTLAAGSYIGIIKGADYTNTFRWMKQ
ncbi:MAG TPA: T9SS type A sorting domain-containing protein [Chitinophagales bacterium]|nr:T9SS type A sorting domain-containing protein [Chitinophagales bacterium]